MTRRAPPSWAPRSWRTAWREAVPASVPGRGAMGCRGSTGRRPARKFRGSSGSTVAPDDRRAWGATFGSPARWRKHQGAGSGSSSCVGSISRFGCVGRCRRCRRFRRFRRSRQVRRVCARRQMSQGGTRVGGVGLEPSLRRGRTSTPDSDTPTSEPRGSHGTDPERPGQQPQRTDDDQRQGHDGDVENQSHGARRVADRPLNGRCAWRARQHRSIRHRRRWHRSRSAPSRNR